MAIQKVSTPVIGNIKQGNLPFKATPQANNYVDYDTFVKSSAGKQVEAEPQAPQARAEYVAPQTQVIEPQEPQTMVVTPAKKGSNFLSGLWSFVKAVGVIVAASFCFKKGSELLSRRGGGASSSPYAAGARELGNKIWEDMEKFPKIEELALPDGLKKLLDKVKRAVDKLPPKLREVIILNDIEDMQQDAIAKRLNCPVGTVKSRLFKARKLLAEELQILLN